MSDQRVAENFLRSEFACPCGCGFDTVDAMLASVLQDERDAFTTKYGRVKIVITGPNRCDAHNRAVGGAEDSTHKEAKAADHKAYYWDEDAAKWVQIDPHEQYDLLDGWYTDSCGIGLYPNRVHFDSRSTKARWRV